MPAPTITPRRARSSSKVRPEIQALRALAVALVVVYHLWPHRLTGGYIGVDVFFVISGFLITGHLLREAEGTGTIAVVQFWARRLRRLLPASLLVVAVSAIVTLAAVPQRLWPSFFHEFGAATLYVENWSLAAGAVDYLAQSNEASPVQHFWSLSAEEQFYVVWPVLIVGVLLLARGLAPSTGRRVVLVVLAVVVAASLAYSVIETAVSPDSAYFITPTRAWEFGSGGVLAAVSAAPPRRLHHLRSGVSWAGIATIAIGAAVYTGATPFPGIAALLPVVGTLAVIWAGDPRAVWAPSGLMRLRPVQSLGDVSYSMYLWHWPLIVLLPFVLGRSLDTWLRIVIFVASILLAWLSKVLIEDRVRTGRPLATRKPRWTFAATAVGMAVILAVTGVVTSGIQTQVEKSEADVAALRTGSIPTCLGASSIGVASCAAKLQGQAVIPSAAAAGSDIPSVYAQTCNTAFADSTLKDCVSGKKGSKTRVILVGDSHAASWFPAVDKLATANGWELHTWFKSTCPINLAGFSTPATVSAACAEWNVKAQARAQEVSPALVITTSDRGRYGYGARTPAQVRQGFVSGWQGLLTSQTKLVVLRDVPHQPTSVLDCAASTGDTSKCGSTQAVALGGSEDLSFAAAEELHDKRIIGIDMTRYFCSGGFCPVVVGAVQAYRDNSSHVTRTYSLTLSSALAESFQRADALPQAAKG